MLDLVVHTCIVYDDRLRWFGAADDIFEKVHDGRPQENVWTGTKRNAQVSADII
jgi:hypothetical protein